MSSLSLRCPMPKEQAALDAWAAYVAARESIRNLLASYEREYERERAFVAREGEAYGA